MEIKQSNGTLKFIGLFFTGFGSAFFIIGVTVGILLSGDPENKITALTLGLAFGFMGLLFFVIGQSMLRSNKKKARKKQRLMETGRRYPGEITSMYANHKLTVNGIHPYIVECTYYNNRGETILVKSENLWPSRRLAAEELTATVFVNHQDPRDYYVSIVTNSSIAENTYYTHDYR